MKKVISSFAILYFVLSVTLTAQKTYEWKEQVGTFPYKYITNDPLAARYYTLANGLTVITSVNKREPRLQTIIATKAGSKTDPRDHTGLAHYLEHMLFKGTDKYGSSNWAKEKPLLDMIDGLYEQYNQTRDEAARKKIYTKIDSVSGEAAKYSIANEYDKLMASIGAKGTNAFTWFEETAYINDVPVNRIDQWLKIEAERFRNPIFRIFHTELEAVYEEKNISLDSDDEKVIDSLMGAMFRKHNYGLQTTIGTIDHLKNPSLKEIRKYYETYYVPNNMCVILAGDFNPDEMIKKVDASFSYMKKKAIPEYTFTPEDDLKKPVEISVYGKEAEYVTFGFRFPGASDSQTELLETLSDLLSNGKAGLLDGLVTRREVLSASAGSFILKDYSMLYFSGNPKEGQTLEQVKDLILAQVERLKKGDFDEYLLKAIVNNRKLQELKNAEKNGGRAFNLLDAFIVGRDRVSILKGIEATGKMTKNEVAAYAQKYLSKSPVIIYKRQGEELNKLAVEKPSITPVELNGDKESAFVKDILAAKPAEVKIQFPDYTKEITKRIVAGNELLHVKNVENDIFSLNYVIPIGYKHKPALRILEEYFGYAGTASRNAEAFDQELYKLACSVSFSVREDETFIGLSGLNENFTASHALLQEKLRGMQADDTILTSLKELILKDRSDAKQNPKEILGKLYSYGFYEGKNPANSVLNNEELKNLRVQELADLMKTIMKSAQRILYYGPSSYQDVEMVISPSAMSLSRAASAPKASAPIEFVDYTPKKIDETEFVLVNYDKVQTDILWVNNGTAFKAELLPVVSLYNEYFGSGMSSVIFQEIRESKALAYSTSSTYAKPMDKKYPFKFYAYIGCQADKMGDAIDAMNGLLKTMPKSEGKFKSAKASLKNNLNSTAIVGADILYAYLNSEKLGITVPISQYVSNGLDVLTLADIEKFQQQYISGKPKTIIIFGDMNKLDKKTAQAAEKGRRIGLEEIFGY